MKHLKTYEQNLRDVPFKDFEKINKIVYKYIKGDFVKFIELNKIYNVNQINQQSDNQDYYLINPLDKDDNGWVLEEELSTPTPEEIEEMKMKINISKYNL